MAKKRFKGWRKSQMRSGWNNILSGGDSMDKIGVKRDGLQLHSIDHTDIQFTSKLIFQNPPTSGHLLSPLPLSPGTPHLDQGSPSS